MEVAVIETGEQMVFDLQVKSIGQDVPQRTVGTKIIGRFNLLHGPRLIQRQIAICVALYFKV